MNNKHSLPKKNFCRVLRFFRSPYPFLALLLLGAVLMLAGKNIRTDAYITDSFFPVTRVSPAGITDIAVSSDGLVAVDEIAGNNSLIYLANGSSDRMRYMLGYKALLEFCGAESRKHILFGDDGRLFLHYVTWSKDGSVIEGEGVLSISPDGKSFERLCGFDHSGDEKPPMRNARLSAFSYSSGVLSFAYTDPSKTEFYSVDVSTGTQRLEGSIESGADGYIGRVFALDGRYLLVRSDGGVFILRAGEQPSEPVYGCETSFGSAKASDIILNAAEVGGRIYVTRSFHPDTVYTLENGTLEEAVSLRELYGSLSGDDIYGSYGLEITKLGTDGKRLVIGTKNAAFAYSDGEHSRIKTAYELPASNIAAGMTDFIARCLLVLSGALFAVFILLVKKTILVKQLMISIPLTGAALGVIFIAAQSNLNRVYLNSCVSEMTAVCELCAENTDISGLAADPSECCRIKEELLKLTERNRGYWNKRYDISVCVPTGDGKALVCADSSNEDMPYSAVTDGYTLGELKAGYLPNSRVCFFAYEQKQRFAARLFRMTKSYSYEAITPLFDDDGNYAAFLSVKNDSFSFGDAQDRIRLELLKVLIPCMLALAAAMTAVSVYISAAIKKATAAVARIADGDFSARADSRAKDELGEICRGVNTMADSLDRMFREKDENEHFYYKFVPEKFRELLGKEKFTDLELGDAESRELTVLFCDIRSFSINSEMMTAKENFEFVNKIYGRAGPLVRKHGGFVDKYIGDAVMALFEEPDSAVACGIELYKAIVLDNTMAEELGMSDIKIGIGIHTGLARIGIVGESERLSGTVISDTVNLSSRLESLTKQYNTAMLVSKDTIDRMSDPESLDLRYLGILQVAGVNEVKAVYEVLDCLGGDIRSVRSENKADLREAVRLFHLGRRSEAAERLEQMKKAGKADDTAAMYLEYIKGMSPDDKANVFRFVRK